MAKPKKLPKKRKSNLAPKRPVVSVRLPEGIAADITAEAKARNVAVSEVVFSRLLRYEALKASTEWDEIGEYLRKAEAEPWQTEEVEGVLKSAQADDLDELERAVRRGIKDIEAVVERGIANLEFAVGAAVERGIARALKDRKE